MEMTRNSMWKSRRKGAKKTCQSLERHEWAIERERNENRRKKEQCLSSAMRTRSLISLRVDLSLFFPATDCSDWLWTLYSKDKVWWFSVFYVELVSSLTKTAYRCQKHMLQEVVWYRICRQVSMNYLLRPVTSASSGARYRCSRACKLN